MNSDMGKTSPFHKRTKEQKRSQLLSLEHRRRLVKFACPAVEKRSGSNVLIGFAFRRNQSRRVSLLNSCDRGRPHQRATPISHFTHAGYCCVSCDKMKMKMIMNKFTLILLLLIPTICYSEPRLRPDTWGKPVIGIQLKNIYLVDKGVYRSEQPHREDLNNLKSLGIKEVLSLREFHGDEDDITDKNIMLHSIEMRTGKITVQQIIESLRIIKNRKGPILIHCWHGSDRTGVTIAAYRIIFNNWSKSKALDEMVNGGYGYHEKIYPELVELVKNLDVANIKMSLKL